MFFHFKKYLDEILSIEGKKRIRVMAITDFQTTAKRHMVLPIVLSLIDATAAIQHTLNSSRIRH